MCPEMKWLKFWRDLEASAMLKGVGAWSRSDSDKIAESRAMQRKNNEELDNIKDGNKKPTDF